MVDLRLYQRGSALAVVLLLIIVLVIKWVTFSIWDRGGDVVPEELATFSAEMDSMKAAASMATSRVSSGTSSMASMSSLVKNGVPEKKNVLQNFDPNIADSTQLASLGMRPYLNRNILKYSEKGGRLPQTFRPE